MPTATQPALHLPREALAEYCRRNGIRFLSLFGSFLHGDAHADSDVDLLVEYEPDRRVGLFSVVRMEWELTELLGRKVDLRTEGDLSRYFRARVVAEAERLYESGRSRVCITHHCETF